MGYYVIAVGGTGNKILEAIVYGAAAGAFYTPDKNGVHVPLPTVRALAVDVDAACGNTTRAKQAGEYYERIRAAFPPAFPRRGFWTELDLQRWNMNLSKRASSVDSMVKNHKIEQLLASTLFAPTESSLEYAEGFRGHPDLGVLFFADVLKTIDEALPQDEMARLLSQMRGELEMGQRVKVMLVGSIFGGTGASGIPAISRFLREHFAAYRQLFELGAVLMLPYYKVPASTRDETMEIVVKSADFLDKARTALQYYGMEGMIGDGTAGDRGVYDAIYLLGLQQEDFVSTKVYSTGSQSQENDAHMLEWLAMRCVSHFFRTSLRGEGSTNMNCYYYQLHSRRFSWDSFDTEADEYRLGFGGLLKAAAAFFSECYPFIGACVKENRNGMAVNYYAAFFSGVRRFGAAERAQLEKMLDSLSRLLAFYTNWMIQLLGTLPPVLRKERTREGAERELAGSYEQLLELRLAGKNTSEVTQQITALAKSVGGEALLNVLHVVQTECEKREKTQAEALNALEKRIALWEGEDANRIAPEKLKKEKHRLLAMRESLASLQKREQCVREDVELAIKRKATSLLPEPDFGADDEIPQNDLIDAGLLTALGALLREQSEKQPDEKRSSALCDEIQQNIERLVIHRVPDLIDMPRLIAALAGGPIAGKNALGAVTGFLASLLNAVFEEGYE